mmetsp:Transcript_116863/g.363179  ORF Transcript_116863/g.363179 Transcript_116863/m.363179 type:complete len:279 (+) Transcript_116863:537-1373(+)
MRGSDSCHGVDLDSRVLQAALAADDGARLLRPVDHDLGQQHVLHRSPGLLFVVTRVEGLKGFVEVGVGGPEVLLSSADDPGEDVNLRLEQGRTMDGIRVRLGCGQFSLGLGDVLQRVVRAAGNQVDLHQEQLVVELLDFREKLRQQLQGVLIPHLLQVQPSEPRLDPLPQERPLLSLAPLDAVHAHLDLQRLRVRGPCQEVDEGPHELGGLGLRQLDEEGTQLLAQRADVLWPPLRHQEVPEGVDGLLASFGRRVVHLLPVVDDVLVRLDGHLWVRGF